MARRRRHVPGGYVHHTLNRGVRRSLLFKTSYDYQEFQWLMGRAAERVSMRVIAYVLMPNHWHLVLWPEDDGAVSAYLKWLEGTHAGNFNRRYRQTGAVYQGRFRNVPVLDAMQVLRVVRYVEANPVRAGLVSRAEFWQWSSVSASSPVLLTPSPIARPPQWLDLLADPTLDLTFLG